MQQTCDCSLMHMIQSLAYSFLIIASCQVHYRNFSHQYYLAIKALEHVHQIKGFNKIISMLYHQFLGHCDI